MSIVIIPSIGASERFEAVIAAATGSSADMILILENQEKWGDRHSPSAWSIVQPKLSKAGRLFYVNAPGSGIHRMWNYGLEVARFYNDTYAVILNDDVELPSGTIDMLIEALASNQDYAVIGADYFTPFLDPVAPGYLREVFGTYRHHGVGGFAFACRADRCSVDEQFEIWGGDDDLIKQAMADGWKIGILDGAPVRHPVSETTVRLFPELIEAKDRDRERMRVKWDDPW